MSDAASLYESFNARFLAPTDVARTFIPPPQFRDITRRAHTLIIGPRGSGKTTVLKMLHPAALGSWEHADAAEYRERVNYTGVFVGTDRSWREQLVNLNVGEDADSNLLMARAAFTTHVLRALVDSMLYRLERFMPGFGVPYRKVNLSASQEGELVTQIAHAWFASPLVPSFEGLKHALRERLLNLKVLASQEARRDPSGRPARLAEIPSLHLDVVEAVSVAIDVFDDAISDTGGRWALLFDELELAPDWVTGELAASLRSTNEKLLFKMSLSPITKSIDVLHDALAASVSNDFNSIALWYPHKDEGYAFTNALFLSVLNEKGLPWLSPEDVLGQSIFEPELAASDGDTSPYAAPHGAQYRRLAELRDTDSSFAEFLRRRDITLETVSSLPEGKRAEVRKLVNVVATRLTFRQPEVPGVTRRRQKRRSRKNPDLYAGSRTLFALVEGNPRLFIGLLARLLAGVDATKPRVGRAQQNRETQLAANRYRQFLKTIPSPLNNSRSSEYRGLLAILDLIGDYMFDDVVVAPFSPEPCLSFVVDDRVDPALERSLEEALNAGALIWVPQEDSPIVLSTLRGSRFRLSYLLASHYGLPITLGNKRALSRILAERPSPDQDTLEGL